MENPVDRTQIAGTDENINYLNYDLVVRYNYMKCPALKAEIDRQFPNGRYIEGRHYTRGVLRNLTKKDMIYNLVSRLEFCRNERQFAYLRICCAKTNRYCRPFPQPRYVKKISK